MSDKVEAWGRVDVVKTLKTCLELLSFVVVFAARAKESERMTLFIGIVYLMPFVDPLLLSLNCLTAMKY
jgi:hypothetical protein